MDPYDKEFIRYVIAFLLVAGAGIGTFWLWLRSPARPAAGLEKMVEALREENAQLQAELGSRIAELEERVDFAERQLVQERQASRLPQQPKARTPV